MTGRRISRADIPQSIPTLFGDATVAAVIAPRATVSLEPLWEIARSAAGARRVAFVDLCTQAPRLGPPGPAGITDAFLLGSSLSDVVREVSPNLYLIGSGTPPDTPRALWGHARWARLARGFREEGALLLLLVPGEALAVLPVKPDVVLALAAEDVATAVDAGIEIDRVVVLQQEPSRRPSTPRGPPPAPAPRRVRPSFLVRLSRPALQLGRVMRERERRGTGVAIAAVVTAALGLAVAAAFFWPHGAATPARAPGSPASSPATPTTNDVHTDPGDSLFYSVQVAAFQSAVQALEAARDYASTGLTPIVAPVRLGRQGVWHRLLVGTLADPTAAQRQLAAIWRAGLLERPNGSILRTPYALRVGLYADAAAAAADAAALRERGIGGYIVETSRGAELLVGAFESPEQADLTDSMLTAGGRSGTLVNRAGIVR